jgi:hypothetical protein
MAKTDEDFLSDRLKMMESDGWLDLIQDLKNIERSVADVNTMQDEKDLWEAKGQLRILNLILSLENTTKLTLEQSQ